MGSSTLSEGPDLTVLLRRVLEMPADFLEEPRIGAQGTLHVPAIVADVSRDYLGFEPEIKFLSQFEGTAGASERNWLKTVLIGCWLISSSELRGAPQIKEKVFPILGELLRELSTNVTAERLLSDADRREELVRLVLKELSLKPRGETEAQALDRLSTLSTVERKKVLRASREAEERARAIREALARKAAQESADKWSRE